MKIIDEIKIINSNKPPSLKKHIEFWAEKSEWIQPGEQADIIQKDRTNSPHKVVGQAKSRADECRVRIVARLGGGFTEAHVLLLYVKQADAGRSRILKVDKTAKIKKIHENGQFLRDCDNPYIVKMKLPDVEPPEYNGYSSFLQAYADEIEIDFAGSVMNNYNLKEYVTAFLESSGGINGYRFRKTISATYSILNHAIYSQCERKEQMHYRIGEAFRYCFEGEDEQEKRDRRAWFRNNLQLADRGVFMENPRLCKWLREKTKNPDEVLDDHLESKSVTKAKTVNRTHNDLQPMNVLIAGDKPLIIDWKLPERELPLSADFANLEVQTAALALSENRFIGKVNLVDLYNVFRALSIRAPDEVVKDIEEGVSPDDPSARLTQVIAAFRLSALGRLEPHLNPRMEPCEIPEEYRMSLYFSALAALHFPDKSPRYYAVARIIAAVAGQNNPKPLPDDVVQEAEHASRRFGRWDGYLRSLIVDFNKLPPVKEKYYIDPFCCKGWDDWQRIEKFEEEKKKEREKERKYRYCDKEKITKSNKEIAEMRRNIKDYLTGRWIDEIKTNPGTNRIFILGEYGTGKTLLCKFLAKNLAERFLDGENVPLPLLIPFSPRGLGYSERDGWFKTCEVCIARTLKLKGIDWFELPGFWDLLKELVPILLIFDGFDELTGAMLEKSARGDWIRESVKTHVNFMLTSRTHDFKGLAEFDRTCKNLGIENAPAMMREEPSNIMVLTGFDEKDVAEYLEKRFQDRKKLSGARNIIHGSYDLADLARRPVLIDLICNEIDKSGGIIQITDESIEVDDPGSLYKWITDRWLERDEKYGTLLTTRKEILAIIEGVAFIIQNNPDAKVNYREFPEIVEAHGDIQTSRAQQEYPSDIRRCAYMTCDPDSNFYFMHRSFWEYFVGKRLAADLKENKTEKAKKVHISKDTAIFAAEITAKEIKEGNSKAETISDNLHNIIEDKNQGDPNLLRAALMIRDELMERNSAVRRYSTKNSIKKPMPSGGFRKYIRRLTQQGTARYPKAGSLFPREVSSWAVMNLIVKNRRTG